MSYLSYLEKTYAQFKYGLTDFLTVQNFTDMLLTSEDIKIYTIKYPGEKLSGITYADEGFFICYNFLLQQEWLRTYNLRNLASTLHTQLQNTGINPQCFLFWMNKKEVYMSLT